MNKDDLSAKIRAGLIAYFQGDALHAGMVPHLTDQLWPQVPWEALVPCGTCGKPCYWVEDAPAEGLFIAEGRWTHEDHPNDDHDAVPPGAASDDLVKLSERLSGGLEVAEMARKERDRLQAELHEAKRDLGSALLKVVDWSGKYYVQRGEVTALRRRLEEARLTADKLARDRAEISEARDETERELRSQVTAADRKADQAHAKLAQVLALISTLRAGVGFSGKSATEHTVSHSMGARWALSAIERLLSEGS